MVSPNVMRYCPPLGGDVHRPGARSTDCVTLSRSGAGVHWMPTGDANTALVSTGAFTGAVAAGAPATVNMADDTISAARSERRAMTAKS